ncbi:MAG: hypothetical protein AAFQ66_22935 [Pseudomonadota bacterium]
MAQAPATAKLRRLQNRLAARLLGPERSAAVLPLQLSEQQALSRRKVHRTSPDNPTLVCLIPLVGAHQVTDWEAVQSRLRQTIESLRAQTDPAWRAIICGQDRPDLPFDSQVEFLPFTEQVKGNDKWSKLRTLIKHVGTLGLSNGYAMPFDADDLMAADTVAYMTQHANPSGYVVERGYMLDAATNQMAKAAPQSLWAPGQKAFWKLCGSCAAFRFDLTQDHRDLDFISAAISHEHRMFPYLAALAGRPLRPLPRPAALYIINHGQNFGVRRGRVSFKTRFVERFRVTGPAVQADLAQRFPTLAYQPQL